jgi:hypothetical protein
MRLIALNKIILLSSNIAETEAAEWAAATTYATGTQVIVSRTADGTAEVTPHKIYQSLADANAGHYPPDSPLQWMDMGATNRWRMFDDFVNTQTLSAADKLISVQIDASRADMLTLFNVFAEQIVFKVIYGGQIKSQQTISLVLNQSTAWSDYFYQTLQYQSRSIVIPFTTYGMGTIVQLDISGTGCGVVAIGRGIYLGDTLYTPKISILDYSKKDTDIFGRTYLKQGAYASRVDADLQIATSQINAVFEALVNVRGTAAVWNFNNDTTDSDTLVTYGFFRDFDIIMQGAAYSRATLSVEGLI